MFGRDASKEGEYKEVGEAAQVKVIERVNRGENLFLYHDDKMNGKISLRYFCHERYGKRMERRFKFQQFSQSWECVQRQVFRIC
jgi:hypothetical protein